MYTIVYIEVLYISCIELLYVLYMYMYVLYMYMQLIYSTSMQLIYSTSMQLIYSTSVLRIFCFFAQASEQLVAYVTAVLLCTYVYTLFPIDS